MRSKVFIGIIDALIGGLIVAGFIYYFAIILPEVYDGTLKLSDFMTYTVIFIVAIVVLIVCLVISLFRYTSKKHSIDKQLAYWNVELGIYNDNMFEMLVKARLPKLIKKSAIITFNIIDFKNLSTQFGYNQGQMILKSVATVLKNKYNLKDAVYAYNAGDMFSVFMKCDDEILCSKDASEIEDKVKKLVFEMGLNLEIKLAFGICFIDDKEITFNEYLRRANIARLSIRSENADRIIFFTEALLNSSADDKFFSAQIEMAFANKEFEVYYQPKFDVRVNRFIAAEALIRWNHPTKGLIRPGSFIPYMERTGQVVKIGRYVFEQVCKDLSEWKRTGQRLLPISINISRVELYQSDLLSFFESMIQQYRVNPLLIEIELTESFASRDTNFATMIMKKIASLRFKVSMDDFGTGYSSLSCLKDMPINILKLDKSFFDDIEIDARSRDIVRLIIELAKALGLYTVAEGIQTAKQVQFIKSTKCDSIQGFYYSEPLNKIDYELLLKKNKFEE